MTLPQPDHPLTEEEIEVYNSCARMWIGDEFAMGSIKTGELGDAFKVRLCNLSGICNVNVQFRLYDNQHYIFATRPRPKQKNTP